MLHIQESFHTSNLLMTPPITVIVQPQPSSSSRSYKVVEQLGNKLDLIHRDIAATRSQLEIIRQAKIQHERDNMHYTNANKAFRTRIKEIMQVLESKQKLLEGTKGSSNQLESKVKQLKDEAMASRHQLEDLRRREKVLEHDRDAAVKERNQTKQKQNLLQDSIEQFRIRCDRETALLSKDYSVLIEQAKNIVERNECMVELVSLKLQERKRHVKNLALMKNQLRENTQTFVASMKNHLQELKKEIEESTIQTRNCTTASIQCRGEFNGLVTRIKTAAAEITASEVNS